MSSRGIRFRSKFGFELRSRGLKSMRILIDARMMTAKATRGIGRYIEELVRSMLVLEPEHRYILIVRSAEHPFAGHPSVETVVADIPWYGVSEQIRLPRLMHGQQFDVIHVPHWNVPFTCPRPLVITIHDLLLRHQPSSAHASTRHWSVALLKRVGYRLTLARAIRRSERVLVPTKFVADDVCALYPHAADKIVVTGEGFGGIRLARTINFDEKEAKPGECEPYFLYVGSAYPHKGLDDLLEAWKEVENRYPHVRLKLAGENDVFIRRLRQSAERLKLRNIDWLGYVSDEQLADLYTHASAFVFPSKFEGFGLPPLEALAAGCPVIAARAGAVPEVLGPDGAFFFEPGSQAGILAAIERLLRDPEHARRHAKDLLPELRRRHDWNSAARITLEAYQSVARHGRPPSSRRSV